MSSRLHRRKGAPSSPFRRERGAALSFLRMAQLRRTARRARPRGAAVLPSPLLFSYLVQGGGPPLPPPLTRESSRQRWPTRFLPFSLISRQLSRLLRLPPFSFFLFAAVDSKTQMLALPLFFFFSAPLPLSSFFPQQMKLEFSSSSLLLPPPPFPTSSSAPPSRSSAPSRAFRPAACLPLFSPPSPRSARAQRAFFPLSFPLVPGREDSASLPPFVELLVTSFPFFSLCAGVGLPGSLSFFFPPTRRSLVQWRRRRARLLSFTTGPIPLSLGNEEAGLG